MKIMNSDDIWMDQPACFTAFVAHQVDELMRIAQFRAQNLYRNAFAKLLVRGQPNLAHSANPELTNEMKALG